MAKNKKPDFRHAYTRKEAEAYYTLGKGLSIEDHAVLDDPEHFLPEGPKIYGERTGLNHVERQAKSLGKNPNYDNPISGDDLAKMRGKITDFNPIDEYKDYENSGSVYKGWDNNKNSRGYDVKKARRFSVPDRANDESRRPNVSRY